MFKGLGHHAKVSVDRLVIDQQEYEDDPSSPNNNDKLDESLITRVMSVDNI